MIRAAKNHTYTWNGAGRHMPILYEVNPPRVASGTDLDERINAQMLRIDEISGLCGGIHVTDSVLGRRRIQAITIAKMVRDRHPGMQITISMRTRDRRMDDMTGLVEECMAYGIDGMLVLMGDPSLDGRPDSGIIPSYAAGRLVSGYGGDLKIYLSLPASPDYSKIQKKIRAGPAGFVTQVIRSEQQVVRMCEMLVPGGFEIIPCVLLPSAKNAPSAEFLGLDWSTYEPDPAKFVTRVHRVAGNVLITSPNDFAAARDVLQRAKYLASG